MALLVLVSCGDKENADEPIPSAPATPTGLALIRCVDPDTRTDAADTLAIGNSIWAPVYGSMPALLPMICMTMGVFYGAGLGFLLMAVPIVVLFVFFRQ